MFGFRVNRQLRKLGLKLGDNILIIDHDDVYQITTSEGNAFGGYRTSPRVTKTTLKSSQRAYFQSWNWLVALTYGTYPTGMVEGLKDVCARLEPMQGSPGAPQPGPNGGTVVAYFPPSRSSNIWERKERTMTDDGSNIQALS